ncbi:YceI family protein [Aequorivita sp. KMM 9714]|uniref:YceI family protein n=1 Tax=Aequorivita sp. KMM 9714 TaxID=2707173 RepID=UPI0013EA2DB9|nr:YceI family protein [Aequorivita sp. KMM 9714]NGX85075.1 YceI family protein [Aequorivita sp. KMM 9714]
MKTLKLFKLLFTSLFILALTTQTSVAQTYNLDNSTSTLKIDGTSNLHDWQIIAENQQGKLLADFEDGKLTRLQQLDFIVIAESLKSGKSGMDKNTYKALNTGKYKQITFKLSKVNNINCSGDVCKVSVNGNLTISGSTKPINISFDMKIEESKISLIGSKTIKMTDFGVDPPTAMFGTITTGDAIDIKFHSIFKK